MLNPAEISDVNSINRRRGLAPYAGPDGRPLDDILPMADVIDDDDPRLAGELPIAPVAPEARPFPLQPAHDFGAEAWKGRDSIVSHARAAPVAAEAPAEDSWWNRTRNRTRNWWSGAEEPKIIDQPVVDESANNQKVDAVEAAPNKNSSESSSNSIPIPLAYPSNKDSVGSSSGPSIPLAYPSNLPSDLPSIRQLCKQIVEKKSKELGEKFKQKESEWKSNNEKITQGKELLKLMAGCKSANGGLDLSLRDAKTLRLIEKLEQRRAAGDPPLPKQYSAEEYNTLFNSIKDEQDNLSFNHNMLAEEMKEMSQERAQVHHYMLSIAKADYDTCRAIIQRMSR